MIAYQDGLITITAHIMIQREINGDLVAMLIQIPMIAKLQIANQHALMKQYLMKCNTVIAWM